MAKRPNIAVSTFDSFAGALIGVASSLRRTVLHLSRAEDA